MKIEIMKTEIFEQIIERFELELMHTTTGMNGYPEWVSEALTAPTRSQLDNANAAFIEAGFEVSEIEMKKKDGWNLWNRYNVSHQHVDYSIADDQDYTIELDLDQPEEEIKSEIRDRLFGTPEEMGEDYDLNEDDVDEFYSDISCLEGIVTVFYNANHKAVNYLITDESIGYHDGDVTTRQLAIIVEFDEEEE